MAGCSNTSSSGGVRLLQPVSRSLEGLTGRRSLRAMSLPFPNDIRPLSWTRAARAGAHTTRLSQGGQAFPIRTVSRRILRGGSPHLLIFRHGWPRPIKLHECLTMIKLALWD